MPGGSSSKLIKYCIKKPQIRKEMYETFPLYAVQIWISLSKELFWNKSILSHQNE